MKRKCLELIILMYEIIWLRHVCAEDNEGHRIKDYNLNVYAGEIVCIFGYHGSGKRVIQSVLLGEISNLSGSIYLDEVKVLNFNSEAAQKYGIVAIDIRQRLIPFLSIEENIFAMRNKKHVFSRFNREAARQQLYVYLEQIQMVSVFDKKVDELTLFEEQMVSVAKALANDAKLIIINYVDQYYHKQDIEKLTYVMKTLAQRGVSFLVFCEKFNSILSMADRVQFVQDGTDTFVYSHGHSYIQMESPTNDLNTPQLRFAHNDAIIGIMDLSWSSILNFTQYWSRAQNENVEMTDKIGDLAVGKNAYIIAEDSAFTLIPTLNIINNICAGMFPRISNFTVINQSMIKYIYSEFSQETGISKEKKEIDELSYFERKLISIYRFQLLRPKYLIFENPYFGMDIADSQKLLDYFRLLVNKNIKLIILSSSLEELNRTCDEVIITNNGNVTTAKNDTFNKKIPTIGS